MDYPFFEKVKSILSAKEESLIWLTKRLEKSDRWIYTNKTITGLALEDILRISAVLEFDFLKDYAKWLTDNNRPPISIVSEPEFEYKTEPGITVGLSIRGSATNIGLHFADILRVIQREGEKYGLRIE